MVTNENLMKPEDYLVFAVEVVSRLRKKLKDSSTARNVLFYLIINLMTEVLEGFF